MASQLQRGNLFDDIFREFAPGFFIKPLHGDSLPAASQIKIDVKESDTAYTVNAEVPGSWLRGPAARLARYTSSCTSSTVRAGRIALSRRPRPGTIPAAV